MKSSILMNGALALICMAQLFMGVKGLSCYRCLNLDCPEGEKECNSVRSFVQSELKSLYYFDNDLDPCPPLDASDWTLLENGEACPEMKADEATCTSGQMRINISKNTNQHIDIYGTVLGCAKQELLNPLKHINIGMCDLIKRSQSSGDVNFALEISHCRETSSMCNGEDFCVSEENSVVTPWPNDTKLGIWSSILMMVLGFVGILALIFVGICKDSWDRYNISKSTGDKIQLVKVSGVQDECIIPINDACQLPSGSNDSCTLLEELIHTPSLPPPRRHKQITMQTQV